jgi:hypothetical protein
MKSHILQHNPPPNQESWRYQLPADALISLKRERIIGKSIKFTAKEITLQIGAPACQSHFANRRPREIHTCVIQ